MRKLHVFSKFGLLFIQRFTDDDDDDDDPKYITENVSLIC